MRAERKRVIIIGAGASGMVAAICAARAGASVICIEHMDRVGKKILSTGNGRCNFTNRDQKAEYYRSGQPEFPWQVVERFPLERTLDFFEELGILAKERNGYLYPNSDQASSILDVLRMEMERQSIDVHVSCQVRSVMKKGKEFVVAADQGEFRGDCLILACGSKAAPVTGSDGSGYELARSLGHSVIAPLPSLVQLRCEEKDYKQLAGIRTEARVSLMAEEEFGGKCSSGNSSKIWSVVAQEQGELQLTDYGISGIPVFQISRYAAMALHNKQKVRAVIDFLPQKSVDETRDLFKIRRETMPDKTCEQWMIGLLNKKLNVVLLKRAGIAPSALVRDIPDEKWNALLRQIKAFGTQVIATNSYEHAQVCCGGVDTAQVDARTLESKKTAGLYFAGEILDVDGICGGYNLQWAWSSGAVAGMAAAGGK